MSAIQDAARRLAENLPLLARTGSPFSDEGRNDQAILAAELAAFGEAGAGRVEPTSSRLDVVWCVLNPGPSSVIDDVLFATTAAGLMRYAIGAHAGGCDPTAEGLTLYAKEDDARADALGRIRDRDVHPPPVDIWLTAEELDAVISWAELRGAAAVLRDVDRVALAKLRAARGPR